MVKNVRISTIALKYYSLNPHQSLKDGVDDMIEYLQGQLNQVLCDQPDLIVLPENCDQPANYSNEKKRLFYKERGDRILNYLSNVANNHQCYIVYSTTREAANGTWLNTSRLIDRQGNIAGTYNKNFPTIYESKSGILSGKDITVVDCDFGRVGLMICFDLNFEELKIKYANENLDVLLFSSTYHGGLMQPYWAYSCRTHFVGSIGNFIPSPIISPVGKQIASTTNYYGFVTTTVNLDCEVIHIDYNRKKIQEVKEKYGSKVTISDPGYIGAVLISSETGEFSIKEVIEEFDLELVDHYFAKSVQNAKANMEG